MTIQLPGEFPQPLTESHLSSSDPRNYWWITTNPENWVWESIFTSTSGVDFFYQKKIKDYFDQARPGDFIFGYEASPTRALVALAQVKKGLHRNQNYYGILVERYGASLLPYQVPWAIIRAGLANSEPILQNAQGTLFALTEREANKLAQMILDRGNIVEFPFPVRDNS